MTRGKHQASRAAQQARADAEEVVRLRAALAAEQAARAEDSRAARRELTALRSDMNRQIKVGVKAGIAAAEQATIDARVNLVIEERTLDTALAAVRAILVGAPEEAEWLTLDFGADVADALGHPAWAGRISSVVVEVVNGHPAPRPNRRDDSTMVRTLNAYRDGRLKVPADAVPRLNADRKERHHGD